MRSLEVVFPNGKKGSIVDLTSEMVVEIEKKDGQKYSPLFLFENPTLSAIHGKTPGMMQGTIFWGIPTEEIKVIKILDVAQLFTFFDKYFNMVKENMKILTDFHG